MKTMNHLGKSFIVGGLIGIAVTKMIVPEPDKNMSRTLKFGMKKFFRVMSAMKRMM